MAFIVNGRDMSEALDRHITGNWGQDQFSDGPECSCGWGFNDDGFCENPDCDEELFVACNTGRCGSCDGCLEAADAEYDRQRDAEHDRYANDWKD
jgi:hypothetical protein